jgi:hypothetical protein
MYSLYHEFQTGSGIHQPSVNAEAKNTWRYKSTPPYIITAWCLIKPVSDLKRICMDDELKGMRWAGHVAQMWAKRNAYRILVGKPEGKRPLGRPRYRWVDHIIMDLGEIEWDGVYWIDLAQDRDQWRALVNTAMNLWVP